MKNLAKGKYLYVLEYYQTFKFLENLNCWGSGNWPRPNGGMWKIFSTRQSAQDFLNFQYHNKKRRIVFERWKPKRIYVSIKDYEWLQTEGKIIHEK